MNFAAAIQTIIAALGGIRATVFAAAGAVLAGLLVAQVAATGDAELSLANSQTELANLRASIALSTAANAEAIASAERRALERTRELSDAYVLAASNYDRGQRDAEATQERIVADLRAGNLQLRDRWLNAESRAAELSGSAGTSGGAANADAATNDREQSAARIVRAAAECDAQVTALQDIVRAVSSASRGPR